MCARRSPLFVERVEPVSESSIAAQPRVGIDSVPEPWRSVAWNFALR
jgi:hypothetical protein